MRKIAPFIHAIGAGCASVKEPIEVIGSRIYRNGVLEALLGLLEEDYQIVGGAILGGQLDRAGIPEATAFKKALIVECKHRMKTIERVYGLPCSTKPYKNLESVVNWAKQAELVETVTSLEGVAMKYENAQLNLGKKMESFLITDKVRRLTAVEIVSCFGVMFYDEALKCVIGLPRPDCSFSSLPWVQGEKQKLIRESNWKDGDDPNLLTIAWGEKLQQLESEYI